MSESRSDTNDDPVKEEFYKFVASPLAPQFQGAHEEQEALWFFRAGHASAGLVFTREQPVREGWYWTSTEINPSQGVDDEIRWVSIWGDQLCVSDDADTTIPAEEVVWWAGPIHTPELPGNAT